MKRIVSLNINGIPTEDAVADTTPLIDYLRDAHQLNGESGKPGADAAPTPSVSASRQTCRELVNLRGSTG